MWPAGRFCSLLFLLFSGFAPAPEHQTLRQAADSASVLIGAAVRPAQLAEPAYAETLSREFNMLEAEDAMKWWVVRRSVEGFDFNGADQLVHFAQAHNMKVRGHCLVWSRDNPAWLTERKFKQADLQKLLQEHIATVVKRYAGQVFAWDVVNEAFDEHGKLRDSLWYNQPGIGLADKGTEYIEQAFRWAHEADPHALLFYNEAEAERLNPKSDAVYTMVKDFKKRGVPIDGVGLQLHISNLEFDTAPVAANIARLAALGIQVHITELDVSLPIANDGQPSAADLQRQAKIYRGIVRACLQNPGCTAIQTWGFSDKYSWIGNHSHGTRGVALPMDHDYKPKPAYDATLEELKRGRSGAK